MKKDILLSFFWKTQVRAVLLQRLLPKIFLKRLFIYLIKNNEFMLHHISTDEVYGDIEVNSKPPIENSPYNPSSPYSATKASSDMLVMAWNRT